jgi:hypothetical protein
MNTGKKERGSNVSGEDGTGETMEMGLGREEEAYFVGAGGMQGRVHNKMGFRAYFARNTCIFDWFRISWYFLPKPLYLVWRVQPYPAMTPFSSPSPPFFKSIIPPLS